MATSQRTRIRHVTQARLHALLRYDFLTGIFWWFPRAGIDPTKPAGSKNQSGYVQIKVDGRSYSASHLAWMYVYGVWPKEELDHRNRLRSDNRIENLREATRTNNVRNISAKNAPGFKGIRKYFNKWVAQIQVNGNKLYLGIFDTHEKAHAAYCDAAQKYHGEFWTSGRETDAD